MPQKIIKVHFKYILASFLNCAKSPNWFDSNEGEAWPEREAFSLGERSSRILIIILINSYLFTHQNPTNVIITTCK